MTDNCLHSKQIGKSKTMTFPAFLKSIFEYHQCLFITDKQINVTLQVLVMLNVTVNLSVWQVAINLCQFAVFPKSDILGANVH